MTLCALVIINPYKFQCLFSSRIEVVMVSVCECVFISNFVLVILTLFPSAQHGGCPLLGLFCCIFVYDKTGGGDVTLFLYRMQDQVRSRAIEPFQKIYHYSSQL